MTRIKLKAIAVDDEKHSLETLVWELSRNCPEVEVVSQLSKEEDVRKIVPVADIDLLFMDIHLQKESGIELVKDISPLDCDVIFVTAYDQYAIQAFEVAATHYLLKPINGPKLRTAIDRVLEKRSEVDKGNIDRILEVLSKTNMVEQRVPFNVQSGIEFIVPENIVYVSGENNYSVLHFKDGSKLMVSKTLSAVENMLANYTFLRIHKSFLLNLRHIVRYVKADGGHIEVIGGDQLSVSRTKRSTISKLFHDL